MSNCTDLCTASKCRELENRISVLEQDIVLLKAAFDSHVQQDIPEAHNYDPYIYINASAYQGSLTIDVTLDSKSDSTSVGLPSPIVNQLNVNASVEDKQLTIDVSVDDKSDSATIDLPTVENVTINSSITEELLTIDIDVDGATDSTEIEILKLNQSVTFDIFDTGDGNYLFKSGVNGETDEDTLNLKEILENLLADLIKDATNVNGYASFVDDKLSITIAVGNNQDTFDVEIPISELTGNDFNSDLNINGIVRGNELVLTIADGNSYDTVSINLPRSGGGGSQHIPSNLSGTATYEEEKLTISIADGESQAVFQVEIKTMDDLTKEKIDKIYRILGGDDWAAASNGSLSMAVKPEGLIKEVGNVLYSADSDTLTELTVTNALELFTAFSTVDFYRSGHHRLPATFLTSLLNTEEGNVPIEIYDSLSVQEWLIRQLDSLIGEFPLKLKYKSSGEQSQESESEIRIENISEAILESLGLILSINENTDVTVNIAMKALVEAAKASNAATVAVDYGQANAEYLGYKGNQIKREIKSTFTPRAKTLKAALKPSTQQIVGWENEDKETLLGLIKKTLIGTEIIKAALFHPYQPGGEVTGDAIKRDLKNKSDASDKKWEEFVSRTNNPSGRYQIPKPKAKIRDLTIKKPDK